MNQRWRNQRDSYWPAGEIIDPRRYEVAPIDDDTTAKAFVLQHHYSGTFLAARYRFGLYAHKNAGGAQEGGSLRGEAAGRRDISHSINPCTARPGGAA